MINVLRSGCVLALVACPALADCDPRGLPALGTIRADLEAGSLQRAEAGARERYEALSMCGDRRAAEAAALDLLVEVLRKADARGDELLVLAERACGLKVELYGERSAEHATSLRNLGRVLARRDRGSSIEVLERTLALRQELLGDHVDTALSARDLGNMLQNTGEYARARELYESALRIQTAELGPRHVEVAKTRSNLAVLFRSVGDLEQALEQAQLAVDIAEPVLGPEDPVMADHLHTLALVYRSRGDYAAAAPLYERCLAIRKRTNDPDSRRLAVSFNNTANLYLELADYAKAASLYEQAAAIFERHDEESLYARVTNNAGIARVRTGDFDGAIRDHQAALEIFERLYGRRSTRVARTLSHLANAWSGKGEWDRAVACAGEATSIREEIFGEDHPALARDLLVLAGIERERGEMDSARSKLRRAVTLTETAVAKDHPLVGDALFWLAVLELEAGRREQAVAAAMRAFDVANEHLRATVGVLSERQALAYGVAWAWRLDVLVSALDPSDAELIRQAWDRAIRARGVVLDEIAWRLRQAIRAESPEARDALQAYRDAATTYASIWIRGVHEDQEPAEYRAQLRAARERAEQLESRVARSRSSHNRARNPGFAEVAGSLGPNDALVSFFLYGRREADSREVRPSYVAFVLAPGSPPRTVDLGDESNLASLAREWWGLAARSFAANGEEAVQAEAAFRVAGRNLREAVWDPIAAFLTGARRIFLVPDGALNLVNFAALPVPGGRYLVEESPTLHYLTTERDLTRDAPTRAGTGLLALGGTDYSAIEATEAPGRPGTTLRGTHAGCAAFRNARWPPLPATLEEVREIGGLWQTWRADPDVQGPAVLLTGQKATEAALRSRASGRRVLHLATHGYFLDGECESSVSSIRGLGGLAPTSAELVAEPVSGENPWLMSGLVLAGANVRDRIEDGGNDGILTAQELATLDLSGVEWAVLSACDTGRGEIRSGEGVFGLRRAMYLSGARTVIMSLWPVGDETTRAWMRRLYRNRFEEDMGTAEAMHATYLRTLDRLRRDDASTHPFFWASFIAAGDWR